MVALRCATTSTIGMTFTDAIYQRWFAAKQQGDKMKYQVTVVIEADKLTGKPQTKPNQLMTSFRSAL